MRGILPPDRIAIRQQYRLECDQNVGKDTDDVTSDNVLEQVEFAYDTGSHVILTTTKQHFHDDTGTGELGTASNGNKARVSYQAAYYDGADRLVNSVDVGTNGGSSYTRPGSVPSRSDTVLVTTYGYAASGLLQDVTDPKGILTKTTYDNIGRVTKTVENYTNGTVTDTTNKTTEFTYNAVGRTSVKVNLPSSGQQTTEWVYGVTTGGGNALNSNDLIKEVRYPDPSTGASSSTDKDVITSSALGQKLTVTDRNGNVHTYTYDILGRQTADAVTTLGSGVDGSVRLITTAYDSQGNAYIFTSYDATSSGSVVNQVKREFNGLGQLTKEWQEHSGAVNGSSSNVQYTYSEMASSANHSRLTSMTYASGYVVNYNYASGLDSNISRLTSISDSSNTLESLTYLGLGTVVKRAHSQSGVDLSYIKLSGESTGDAGDQYTGLDRFGRIVDQRWINGSNVDVDRFKYGYDRNGNVLYKENIVNTGLSEVYTYDDLNQLASYKLGTLNVGKTDVTGSPTNAQSWDYDATGNWDSITTNGTTQARGANKQNEITSVSGATTPTYDNNGNLTKDENNYRFVWDAWNREVKIKNSSDTVIATNSFDALSRKVKVVANSTTTDRLFSSNWQLLEEKVGSNTKTRNVWSPVYIDAMVSRDRDTDANGSLDERLYALQDTNFNMTAVTNTSGTVQEKYTETPFGVTTFRNSAGSTISVSTKDWNYLHQGGQADIIGNLDFRNRVLSPTLGRWLSNDPLGFNAGDVNLYRYLGDGPGTGLDPTGQFEDGDLPPSTIPPFPVGTPPAGQGKLKNPIDILFGDQPVILGPPSGQQPPPPNFQPPGTQPVQPAPTFQDPWRMPEIPQTPKKPGGGYIKGEFPLPWSPPPQYQVPPDLLPPDLKPIEDLINNGPIFGGGYGPGYGGPPIYVRPNDPKQTVPSGEIGVSDGNGGGYKIGTKNGIFYGDADWIINPIDGVAIQPSIGATVNPKNGDFTLTPGFSIITDDVRDLLRPILSPIKTPIKTKLTIGLVIDNGGFESLLSGLNLLF